MLEKMMKYKRILTGVPLICMTLFTVLWMGGMAKEDSPAETKTSAAAPFVSEHPDEYAPVYGNGLYVLNYCEQPSSVSISSAETGAVLWNSIVTRELYDLEQSAESWKKYMQSMLAISYTISSEDRGDYIKAYSTDDSTKVSAFTIQGGLRLLYDFTNAEIGIVLEMVLDEDGLKIEIPFRGIREGEEYSLYSVELLPFFGAASPEDAGYMVYPEGNGALSYFNRTENKQLYAQSLSLDIYGRLEQESLLEEHAGSPAAMLPAFGIKRGNNAFLAAITKGDSSARILVNPSISSSAVALNRTSFELVYRNEYRTYLSNLITKGRNSSENLYGKKLDQEMIPLDREIRFFFLEKEHADYSGMASVYRDFLLNQGLLKKSPLQNNTSLALEFFMGAEERDSILKQFVVTTAFEDVISITKEYQKSVEGLHLILRGWSAHGYGYAPQSFQPENQLGGKKGLKALNELARETSSLNVFLETDMVSAKDGTWGFSKGRDVVVTPNGIPVTNFDRSKFILSPFISLKLFEKSEKQLEAYPAILKAYTSIGERIYHDYNSKNPVQRQKSLEAWQEIVSREGKPAAIRGGNLYLLSSAQRLYGIDTSPPMSQITDETIPWFQMMVYNSIPYTGEAGNTSYDLQQLKLKWLEYGCVPSFELTQNSPALLKNTHDTRLFTSENSKWSERILDVYHEWEKNLSEIQNVYMTKHERLSNGVVAITYQNGMRIAINYSESQQLYDEIVIAPEHYVVLGV